MLLQVQGVSASLCAAIMSHYPTISSLLQAYRDAPRDKR
jgi:hypothetical protein